MFVTKSGIVVVAIERSGSSTTSVGALNAAANESCRLVLTIRSYEGFLLERWRFPFLVFIFIPETKKFRVPGTDSQVRRRRERWDIEYSLFGSLPSLSFLAFFLTLFASTLLNALLLCGDAWDNIIKWIIHNADRFDFGGAMLWFQG